MADETDRAAIAAQLTEHGFCVVENVISPSQVASIMARLWAIAEGITQAGGTTHTAILDPNAQNVRVYDLPEHDPVFVELLRHPIALGIARDLLGEDMIVSNFSANIARPGSQSMRLHSDQALVIPPPWIEPWAMNIIWCLDDVHEGNGATRYLPGSHRLTGFADIPADAVERTLPFAAPAGSLIAMDGRMWHMSGENRTADENRAMMFAYYTRDFIRQQVNWNAALSPEVQMSFDDETRALFGLGPAGNIRIATPIITLGDQADG
jgi:ectoine hydroxylase-related dioxygenase (phytanoyl-CoA dioxygenase family)